MAGEKRIKPKKCRNPSCKQEFQPTRPLQVACSIQCAVAISRIKNEQNRRTEATRERKERRSAKERLKTRGDWLREAQAAFNRYIRIRDTGLPCISCDKPDSGARDASHYRARSVSPELRFNEDNCHAACVKCNQHMHGNLIEYRIRLIRKIGLDKVEWLESQHEPAKYSIEDLKEIKEKYGRLARELMKRNNHA